MRMAAGHYVGGALVNIGSQQVAAGNTGYGIAAGTTGGMLQGAAAGMGLGFGGIVAGAAIGGLNQALTLLNKAAEQATAAILEQVRVQQQQIKAFHDTKKGIEREQELREFAALSDEELIRITKELPAAKTMLEDFTTGVAGKKFAEATREAVDLEAPQTLWESFLRDIGWTKKENRTEKNFIEKRDEKLKEL